MDAETEAMSDLAADNPMVTPDAKTAVEVQLEQLGFSKESVRTASASLDAQQSINEVCEMLLSVHPDGVEAIAQERVSACPIQGDTDANVEPPSLKRAKTMVSTKLLRGMSQASQQVLKKVSSRHMGISNMAVVRLLLRAAAALRQGLLDQEQRHQLHTHLESGDIDLVHAVVLGIGVRSEPNMPLDEGQEKWECCICFTEQEEQGWQCPNEHRYCSDCMTRHVDSVQFPRCPTIACGYEFEEKDLLLLRISQERIDAFRDAKLRGAIDSLDTTGTLQTTERDIHGFMASRSNPGTNATNTNSDGDVLLRCPNESCQNVVLIPRRVRQRYVCVCGSVPFCTHCRLAPYHYYAGCSEVQPLRQRWLEWLSGGRDDYFGRARASASFDKQLQALREAVDRHKELEADEQWKAKHCRTCPNCKKPVQKLSGCDSMQCGSDAHGGNAQPGCGTSFEWRSAAPYEPRVESKELPGVVAEDIRCRGHSVLHAFVDCSVCGTGGKGIIGPRFRCLHCASFDVCQACEPKLGETHPPDHVFQIMLESDFSWGGIRLPVGTKVRLVRHGDMLPVNLEDVSSQRQLEGLCGSVSYAPEALLSRNRSRDASPKRYEWQGDRGRWHAYDASANATIVEAALRGANSVNIAAGGTNYTIDFRRMRQRNMSTGGSRPCRAVPDLTAESSSRAKADSAMADPYRITLDQGGDVVVVVAHLDPVLQSRQQAEDLIAKALTEQEDGIPPAPEPHDEDVEEEDDYDEEDDE